MSLESWKEEFYPIKAEDCKIEDILKHSILKWSGLLPGPLKKHGVTKRNQFLIYENTHMSIDAGTCALCEYYKNCNKCILKDCIEEWATFLLEDNAVPMLDKLKNES